MTKAEKLRIERMKAEIGCICCRLTLNAWAGCEEVHHILIGNRRAGHWWTLPLCYRHHQGRACGGVWTSIAQGSKAFSRIHGTQWDLWLKVQHMLNLDDTLPPSKLASRRL